MTYQEALNYIWSLVNFETKPPEEREPYKLDRMVALMAQLGNPQECLRVLHVAGTKGKGSTSSMIESVLRAAGYKTGLYTSPHLHDVRERLRINGELIAKERFIRLIERLRSEFELIGEVTTFEALTAMAFMWFAESGVDLVVLEVGLGGRLDATNLVTPLVSVITPLALEHTAVLGNTIEEIAAEKGGIIKHRVPVVSADQPPAALAVLREMAAQRNAPLVIASERWRGVRQAISLAGQQVDFAQVDAAEHVEGDIANETEENSTYTGLTLRLLGQHQIQNACVVMAVLEVLRQQGVTWDEAALRDGFSQVKWPARVEVLQKMPLVIADGAHTQASASALINTLNDLMPKGWSRSTLILGISSNKNFSALLDAFDPIADQIILTRAHHPRAANPAVLAAYPALATRQVRIVRKISDALQTALADAGEQELIVATGSLFVAAEARAAMGKVAL